MRCPVCGRLLEVAAEFVEARTEDEVTTVYSSLDLMCTNPACPNGRLGLPVKRVRRPLMPARRRCGTVSCCGVPLVYINGDSYIIPDGVRRRKTGSRLSVTCSQCGRIYLIDVGGKDERSPLKSD